MFRFKGDDDEQIHVYKVLKPLQAQDIAEIIYLLLTDRTCKHLRLDCLPVIKSSAFENGMYVMR